MKVSPIASVNKDGVPAKPLAVTTGSNAWSHVGYITAGSEPVLGIHTFEATNKALPPTGIDLDPPVPEPFGISILLP